MVDVIRLTVVIDKECTEKGVPNDCAECPLALAVLKAAQQKEGAGFNRVSVTHSHITAWRVGSRGFQAKTPSVFSDFMHAFDTERFDRQTWNLPLGQRITFERWRNARDA